MYGQDYAAAYQSYAPQLGIAFGNAQMQMQMPPAQPVSLPPQPTRVAAGFGNKDKLSNDTSSKDPTLMKSRVFIGNLNTGQCARNDLIDLCQPYGRLKALSLLKGYAFVQYETQTEAEMAIKILNAYDFYGQKLDVRMAAMGKGSVVSTSSSSGPVRRPKHDFLFGGQRIRVETTNVRNRTFSQDVFGAIKEIEFYDHGKDDTMICGTCRSVFSNIKNYIEHRRQKKCNFFEREVAPTVVSCFTCKEEFNESWEFIQHLIHRHSINL
jgi:RNA recognition motif-containing protein